MHDLINTPSGDKATRLYGLIGYPLSHSFSKSYFEEKFKKEGITNCLFENFPIQSIHELKELLQTHRSTLKGLAITIPYKQQVLEFLNSSEAIPAELNACNCIRIENDNLIGYNTDWIGFEKSFVPLLKPHHTKALVLGNGGAAIAVCYVLKKMKIDYQIVSRKLHRGSSLTYNDLSEKIIKENLIIINTTPLGMYPGINEAPTLDYSAITTAHYLFDLIYNPDKTLFLQKGEAQGATIKNGADMLVLQAEENWRIWNS